MPEDEFFGQGGLIERMQETGGFCAQAATSLIAKSDNERSSVLSTALEQTAFLASPAMARGLGTSTFDIDALKTSESGLTVYLCLPARRLRTHSRFLRLLLMVTLARMEAVPNVSATQATANGWPVLFMIDEFPVLGHMDVIESAAGLMREPSRSPRQRESGRADRATSARRRSGFPWFRWPGAPAFVRPHRGGSCATGVVSSRHACGCAFRRGLNGPRSAGKRATGAFPRPPHRFLILLTLRPRP